MDLSFKVKKAKEILLERIKIDQEIYYSDLYRQIGLDYKKPDHRKIGSQILTMVNEADPDCMVTSYAILNRTFIPGDSFFKLAETWNKIRHGANDLEKKEFWKKEKNKVYKKYGK